MSPIHVLFEVLFRVLVVYELGTAVLKLASIADTPRFWRRWLTAWAVSLVALHVWWVLSSC